MGADGPLRSFLLLFPGCGRARRPSRIPAHCRIPGPCHVCLVPRLSQTDPTRGRQVVPHEHEIERLQSEIAVSNDAMMESQLQLMNLKARQKEGVQGLDGEVQQMQVALSARISRFCHSLLQPVPCEQFCITDPV